MPRKLGEVRTRDLVVLWGKAAGRCSHPDCKRELVAPARGKDEAAAIGQAAHIVAPGEGGPRGEEVEPERIHGYENLILLCGHHHPEIDRQTKSHSPEKLRAWKTEHEAWVAARLGAPEPQVPWTAILQDPEGRADAASVEKALGAGNCAAERLDLGGEWVPQGWEAAAKHEFRALELTLKQTPAERRRFAVFSLGRIPLAVHLGYVLGDRARAEVYHYDRDRGSWEWDAAAKGEGEISVRCEGDRGGTANLRVSLSARVDAGDVPPAEVDVEIAIAEPSVRWLRHRRQLAELKRAYETALREIVERGCERVRLFYAGPAAGAVEFGRGYNPRMNPPLELYEYRRGGQPRYEAALVLNG